MQIEEEGERAKEEYKKEKEDAKRQREHEKEVGGRRHWVGRGCLVYAGVCVHVPARVCVVLVGVSTGAHMHVLLQQLHWRGMVPSSAGPAG